MRLAYRRSALTCLLVLAMTSSSLAAQEPADKQREFDAGISRLKLSDATVDIKRLRQLSTELDGYDPYASGANHKEMLAAIRRSESKEALRLARLDLEADYLDVDAHMTAMIASKMEGDDKSFKHHRSVVIGIVDSIVKSGDGKSADTALVVVTVREEYAVLQVLGLRMKKQGLVRVGEHSFDVLTVINPETKAESSIYFNIDAIIDHQEKLFSPDRPAKGVGNGGSASGPTNCTAGPARPADVSSSLHRLEPGALAAMVVRKPQLANPALARVADLTGEAIVEVTVSETGVVESTRALSGHPLLRDAAVTSARSWVFAPFLLEGTPVKVVGTITFKFHQSE